MRALSAIVMLVAAVAWQSAARAEVSYSVLSYDQLDGWADDNHQKALDVFLETCADMDGGEWASVCALASQHPRARVFFELFFRPVLIEDGTPALFTGYFEPVLSGSRTRTAWFRYPVYRKPPELRNGTRWYTREQIENEHILAGRGLEIAWVDNAVDLFFLQLQGSGRIRLQDGSMIRVGYGGANGHNYRSIGAELVRRGVYNRSQVSAQVIRNWVSRNPIKGAELLRTNPAYVFFRELRGLPDNKGPVGAMNRPITAMRSIAIDPAFVPLGAPVWVEKGGAGGFRRLMIAQDTGSAIKGAQRADIFYGTGRDAGKRAAQVHDPGRMVVLMPIEEAFARAGGAAG